MWKTEVGEGRNGAVQVITRTVRDISIELLEVCGPFSFFENESKLGGTCIKDGRDDKCIKGFGRKTWREKTTWET
jgi:hypothetical protein